MSLLVRLASSSFLVFCLGLLLKTADRVTGQGCNCLRVEDCDPEQKLCHGKCAYGYLNPPLCLDVCPPNMYGLDCMMTCHCPDDDTCEKVQGVCSSLRCHPDWAGAGCSKRLPKLHSPPRVVSSSCTAVRVQWHQWEPTLDYGDYPVLEYRLYKMTSGREGQGSWEEVTRRQQREGVTEYTADVPLPSLSHPRAYKFRVDAFYDDYGKLSALASPGIETDFIVPCTGTDQFSVNISTVPSERVFQSKVIQNVHHNVRSAREVEVTWSVSDPSLLDSLYVTYSYQVIQVGDCLAVQQDKGKGYVVELKGSRSRLMLHNLEPWHTYHFNLRAASPSLPEEEEVTEGTFATSSAPPTGPVQTLTIFNISSTSASASWLKPSCPTRGGVLVYFELELREVDNSLSLPLAFYSSSQEVTFYNLQPATRYCLRVRYVNPAGQGPFSECANLTTTATSQMRAFVVDGRGRFPRSLPPRPSNLRQTSSSVDCVGMAWDSPVGGLSSAPIQGFRIFDLTGQTYSQGMEPLPLAPGPTARSAMVCGLQAGRSYVLGLSSRSLTGDDSVPITAVFTTDHDKPEKPATPKVVSRSLTTVVISIRPVTSSRGPVTAYDIYVEVAELSEKEKVDAGFPRSPRGIVDGDEDGMYYVRKGKPGTERTAIVPDSQSSTFPRQGELIEVVRSRGNTSTLTSLMNRNGTYLPTATKFFPVGNATESEQSGVADQQNGTTNLQNGTEHMPIETKNLRSGMENLLNGSSNREQSILGKNATDILDEVGKEGLSTLPFLIEKGRPDVQKWGVRVKPEEFATKGGLPSTTLEGFKPPANNSATVGSPNATTLVSGIAKMLLPGISDSEMAGNVTTQDEHSSSSGKSNILEKETSPAKTRSGRTTVMQSPSNSPVSPVQVRSISFSLRGERQRQVSSPSSMPSLLPSINPAVTEITERGAALSSGDQGAGAAATEENGGLKLEELTKGVTSSQLNDSTTTQPSLLSATRRTNDTDTEAEADNDVVMNRNVSRLWSRDPLRNRRGVDQNPPPGRIQARLGPERIKGEAVFVIGDDAMYGGYKNSALRPDGRYNVYLVANSFWNGANKFAASDPVTVLMPREITVYHAYARNARFVNAVVIIFFVVAALFLALTVSLWDGCMRWQHRRRQLTELHEPEFKYAYNMPPSGASADVSPASFRSHLSGIELQPAVDERKWSETYNLSQRRHIVMGRNLLPPEQFIELPAQEISGRGEKITFRTEFQSLPRSHPSMNAGERHYDRNLAPSFLPFDATRCVLERECTGQRNYMNNNFRRSISEDSTWGNYIVAQSPFDEGSSVNLWRLIYHQNVSTVVVLSRTIEDGTRKCHQYWPDIGKIKLGKFKISLVDQFPFADFTERVFSVQRTRLRNKRSLQVRHFTFLGWPEKGVPINPIPLLELRDRVRQTYMMTTGPVLVHCDTGSGRSAVFVALDMLLATYSSNGEISVFNTVSALRAERPHMIQTFHQYVFLYDAVFEHQHAGNTVMGDNFRECYQMLVKRNPVTGRSYLRDQFLLLRLVSTHDLQSKDGRNVPDLIPPVRAINRTGNRVDLDIEELEDLEEGPVGSLGSRRNAFFVDSYRRRHHYVLSPTPTPYEVCDFWQLVYDNNITAIIMLDEDVTVCSTNSRRQQGLYWPKSGSLQWEPFIVELVGSNSQNGILTRTLTLVHKYHRHEDPRCIRQFHFRDWGQVTGCFRKTMEKSTQASSQHGRQKLLQMLHLVKMWQDQCSLDSTPVLLHCADGVSGSGVVVALALIIRRMREEGQVSVYRQVRKLHKCSSNIIGAFEQYKFLYKCLWDYTNMNKPGGVFSAGLDSYRSSYPQGFNGLGEWRQSFAGPDHQYDIFNDLDQDSKSSSSSSSSDDRSPRASKRRSHARQWSPGHQNSFSYLRRQGSLGSRRFLSPTMELLSPGNLSAKPVYSISGSSASTDDDSADLPTMTVPSIFVRKSTQPRLSRQTFRSSPSLVSRHLSWSPARGSVSQRLSYSAPKRRSTLSPGYRYSMHGMMTTRDNVGKMATSRDADTFYFKQHSLYPDLSAQTGVVQESGTSNSYVSSLSASHLSTAGGGTFKRSSVWTTSGSPVGRSTVKSPSPRNLSALPIRRSFPSLSSPHRRLTSPHNTLQVPQRQSLARQRFVSNRLDQRSSPAAARVSPQRSESRVKKVTELLDDDGVFYHSEVTDTVMNISSSSDNI